jgi:helix-turn-helix protein
MKDTNPSTDRLALISAKSAVESGRKFRGTDKQETFRTSTSGPRSPTERWGGDNVIFDEGFLSVPVRFLRRYASLNPPLTAGEALFVLQLMTFKWERAAPFPSYNTIARVMGVTDKMARRYAQGLEKKRYLIRQFQRRAPNKFDLTGLFDALAMANGVKREKL